MELIAGCLVVVLTVVVVVYFSGEDLILRGNLQTGLLW